MEWYEELYYQRKQDMFDLSFLSPLFSIKETLYAGVDGAICKCTLIAVKEGTISKYRLGLEVQVRGRQDEVCNEIKRIGYLKDRETPL